MRLCQSTPRTFAARVCAHRKSAGHNRTISTLTTRLPNCPSFRIPLRSPTLTLASRNVKHMTSQRSHCLVEQWFPVPLIFHSTGSSEIRSKLLYSGQSKNDFQWPPILPLCCHFQFPHGGTHGSWGRACLWCKPCPIRNCCNVQRLCNIVL